MKVQTHVQAGGREANHNETLVCGTAKIKSQKSQVKGLTVKTGVKAGGRMLNHNETLVRRAAR